jgi:hypothetical protein
VTGDHPSTTAVADSLKRSTRRLGRAALKRLRSAIEPRSNNAFLTLLQVGFTEPRESPRTLVVSYTTVSPLLPGRRRKSTSEKAVCFLWHYPAGHPGWVLPTTLPCGARTFLGTHPKVRNAVARPTRPPYPQL